MKHLKHFLTLFLVLFSAMAFSQTVTNTVTLDGSKSADDDGTIAAYNWSKVSGPSGGDVMTNANTVKPTIVFTTAGVYIYKLIVTDNRGAQSINNSTVQITVLAANQAPRSDAGGNIIIQLPAGTTSMIKPDLKDERIFYASGTVPKKYDK